MAVLPPDSRPARSFRVQPTPKGVVVVVALVLFMLVGPEVSDPAMAGFVWAALVGAVLVGAIWPCVTVLSMRVEPTGANRSDRSGNFGGSSRPGRVGTAVPVGLRLGARLSEVTLRWVDTAGVVPVAAGPATVVDLPLTPVRRGRFDRLRLRVVCDAPFGLLTASRLVTVEPARPLVIGPATVDVGDVPSPETGSHGSLAVTAVGHGGDTIRSVRPYVSGDPAHLVHWPSSAHAGTLVVRELEPPADLAVAVVVDLGAAPATDHDVVSGAPMPTTPLDAAELPVERAVARAAAVIAALHARGVRVLLCTAQPSGVAGEVGDDDTVAARLAVATGGTPAPVPAGWSVLAITPERDGG